MQSQRPYRLNVRLSLHELQKVHRFSANSTCRSVSEYARKLLTQQPIIQFFRNPSLEELNTQLPPLLENIVAVANGLTKLNPELLDAYGKVLEAMEDIRILVTKLSEQCDPK